MLTAMIIGNLEFLPMILIRCLGFHNLLNVMGLHEQFVCFLVILFPALGRFVTYKFRVLCEKFEALGALLCVDEILSGSGLYQLFLSTALPGNSMCFEVTLQYI